MEAPRLVPGAVAQHSVFLELYGKGKLRQVGALQNAQHQNWRVELIVALFFAKWRCPVYGVPSLIGVSV